MVGLLSGIAFSFAAVAAPKGFFPVAPMVCEPLLAPTVTSTPPKLSLYVDEASAMAQFDYKTNAIYLALKLSYCPTEECRNGVLIHEIAHLVFQYNLRKYSQKFSELFELYQINSGFQAKFFEAMIDLRRMENQPKSVIDVRRKKLAEHLKPLREINDPIADRMQREDYDWRKNLKEVAYEEVFADLLPVVMSRDPDIMADGEFRRFSRVFSESEINNWNPLDEHIMLDPVRSFLFHRYLKNRRNWQNVDRFLESVFVALASDIVQRDANDDMRSMSVPEINKRLLKKLRHIGH